MNEIKQWFLDQSPRDQLMLSIGGAAVLVYVLIFWLLLPAQRDLANKERRNLAMLSEQQEVRNLAGQLMARQQGDASGRTDRSLNAILNESLREFGLTMENFQPSGNSARVRLATSEFNKVLAWLNEMENKHAVVIGDLTITADRNPGAVLVNLQMTQGE